MACAVLPALIATCSHAVCVPLFDKNDRFSFPSVVVAFAFVFFILHRDIPIERPMLYFLTALFYIAVALKTLLIRTQYEQHSMSGLKNIVTLFPGYFNIYSNKQFLLHCFTRYYWIPLATAAIARHYKSHREWRKLVFFCFSVCGYLLLVNISYPTPVTPSFYIENLYLPVGVTGVGYEILTSSK